MSIVGARLNDAFVLVELLCLYCGRSTHVSFSALNKFLYHRMVKNTTMLRMRWNADPEEFDISHFVELKVLDMVAVDVEVVERILPTEENYGVYEGLEMFHYDYFDGYELIEFVVEHMPNLIELALNCVSDYTPENRTRAETLSLSIASLPRLTTLDVEKFNYFNLKGFSQCENLKELAIRNTILQEIPRIVNLEVLTVGAIKHNSLLADLVELQNLKFLKFNWLPIDDDESNPEPLDTQIAHLRRLNCQLELQILEGDHVVRIEQLSDQITSLSFANFFPREVNFFAFDHLITLELISINDIPWETFSQILSLKRLKLAYCTSNLFEISSMENLEEIYLRFDKELDIIPDLCLNLKTFEFTCRSLSPENLLKIIQLRRLEKLKLLVQSTPEDTIKRLSQLPTLNNLTVPLYEDHEHLHLEHFQKLEKLTVIGFFDQNILFYVNLQQRLRSMYPDLEYSVSIV